MSVHGVRVANDLDRERTGHSTDSSTDGGEVALGCQPPASGSGPRKRSSKLWTRISRFLHRPCTRPFRNSSAWDFRIPRPSVIAWCMAVLEQRDKEPHAVLAVEMFCHQLRKHISALTAALGGCFLQGGSVNGPQRCGGKHKRWRGQRSIAFFLPEAITSEGSGDGCSISGAAIWERCESPGPLRESSHPMGLT